MLYDRNSARLKSKRTLLTSVGFLCGFMIGLIFNRLLYGANIDFVPVSFGLLGAALLLLVGEKRKRIATTEELKKLRLEEDLNPLGLSTDASALRDTEP